MRNANLAFYFIVLAVTVAWSQQTPAPEPDQSAPPQAFRAPHSSKEDLAVPMCPGAFNDSLETDGIAVLPRDKGAVTPPRATHTSEAIFSDEARRQGRSLGISEFKNTISMVVGVDGLPRNFCLVQSAGYGLDVKAKEAAQLYRFAPATKDGQPVLVRVTVVMTFKLY